MSYIYIPDTYNKKLVSSKFNDLDSFIQIQILYRRGLENMLSRCIDFKKIESYIQSSGIIIPVVNDKDNNPYHKFSTLGSNYVYLRNNMHVENLSEEEIIAIRNNKLDSNFYQKTYDRVVYEDGDGTFFGPPIDTTLVKSKSFVFEFAYDQKKCTDVAQLNNIKRLINEVFKLIENEVIRYNIPLSFLVYNAIPDRYSNEISNNVNESTIKLL